MVRFGAIILAVVLASSQFGCVRDPIYATGPVAPIASHKYLLHLPGMAGWISPDTHLVQGLGDAGVADHLEIYDWTGKHWMIGAVTAYEDNRAQARKIADAIAAKYREQPDTRIVLTAWSAGGALAIWTLEDLPENVCVDSVLLVQPAVDPDHDLSRALAHVRGHLFATQSNGDFIMLGIGTVIFGSTDGGMHSATAGNVGFRKPPAVDPAPYQKLIEIPYQPEWNKYNNLGGHGGPLEREFAKDVLGPMLRKDQ